MNKKIVIISSITAALAAAAIVTVVAFSGAGTTQAPAVTPTHSATSPAVAATSTPSSTPTKDTMGFDEYAEKYTVSKPFKKGASTVVKAGSITKDCGAEKADEGSVLFGYSVTYSDLAHTSAVEISCTFSGDMSIFDDAAAE